VVAGVGDEEAGRGDVFGSEGVDDGVLQGGEALAGFRGDGVECGTGSAECGI
jgi:hypothetical protein